MAVAQPPENGIAKLPFGKSFAGHETFAARFTWLKKGLDQIQLDPEVFQRDDAVVRLGVGKNMVRSIRHWCLSTRIAQEENGTRGRRLAATELGIRLLGDDGWDPYLEDDATLWLLHWNLASPGTRSGTWYWAFNRFYEYSFVRSTLVEGLLRALQGLGWNEFSEGTIDRDVDCLVHTYLSRSRRGSDSDEALECPFSTLGLLVQDSDGDRLRFQAGPKPNLPPSVFAYALAEFWNFKDRARSSFDVREILGSEGSPRWVFKLDDDSVLFYLEQMAEVTSGDMVFEDTPLVRRVVRNGDPAREPLDYLEGYYGGR